MIERFIYEMRPFMYLGGAFTAHTLNSTPSTNVFVGLLAACMGMVLYWRYQNRTGYQEKSPRR